MSLITPIPVGSKPRTVALHPSQSSNEILLATGSWDMPTGSNHINIFTLRFDPEMMETEVNLSKSKFIFEKQTQKGITGIYDDVNAIKFVDSETIVYASSDKYGAGIVVFAKMGESSTNLHSHQSSACVSLDFLNQDKLAAIFEDGSVVFGDISAFQRASHCNLPHSSRATQVRWLNEQELAISTANSKVIFLDARSASPTDSILVHPRINGRRQLNIRSIDTNPAFSDVLLVTGDDEGSVRLWDRRNHTNPISSTLFPSGRKPISSVKMHPTISSSIMSASIDGSIIQHELTADGSGLEEVWRMPTEYCPVGVNALDMFGSLTVASLDHAEVLAWRAH